MPDLHLVGSGGAVILRPEELRELRLSDPQQVEAMLLKYNSLDLPRESVIDFMAHLVQRRDSWFVEAGDLGLFYFTNITPRVDAVFNMLFWDRRLTGDRREAAKLALHAAASLFKLRRVSAMAVESNKPLRKTLQKIGFTAEGCIRQSRVVGDHFEDAHYYGLLNEEMTWPLLKTSLV
jgi:hypothetical protein